MKSCLIVFPIMLFLMAFSAFSLAGEKKDHICFHTVDADKDKKVTFQEFEKYYGNNEEHFKRIDRNNDGVLTHEEYHESLGHGAS